MCELQHHEDEDSMSDWKIIESDVLDALKQMPDNSVDAVLTDPPYGIGSREPTVEEIIAYLGGARLDSGGDFMGKKWELPSVEVWREMLRVLRPGGHVLAFGGTRMFDLLVLGVRAGGFEVRDVLMWMYACLDEETEILVDGKWCHYSAATAGRLAMCYDAKRDEFSWRPIENLFVYQHNDTAYRVRSDRTDQVVTRNHRCLVERGGAYTFEFAEDIALQLEARVPILEDVQGLLESIPVYNDRTGGTQQDMRAEMCCINTNRSETPQADERETWNGETHMPVRNRVLAPSCVGEESRDTALLQEVQRARPQEGAIEARAQGSRLAGIQTQEVVDQDVRLRQSGMAWRNNVQTREGQLSRSEVRSMYAGVSVDVYQERIRDGASIGGRNGDWKIANKSGIGTSYQSRSKRQSDRESDALSNEPRPQVVRASRFTRSDLARFEPFHLRGIVWCVSVPTGAFVARRNGKTFITGNSGMPKSLQLDKAIDSYFGAERPVVGTRTLTGNAAIPTKEKGGTYGVGVGSIPAVEVPVTAPATPEAARFEGWGTNLKPCYEPIVLSRKHVEGTIAKNALAHGTGGLNIAGCRIEIEDEIISPFGSPKKSIGGLMNATTEVRPQFEQDALGRWPSNIVFSHCHSDSEDCPPGCPVAQLDAQSGDRPGMSGGGVHAPGYGGGMFGAIDSNSTARNDSGGASRFFFVSKSSRSEREFGCEHLKPKSGAEAVDREEGSAGVNNPRAGAGRTAGKVRNFHPTVKPIRLAKWLATLLLPPPLSRPRRILTPYSGSGSEMIGAMRAGWDEVVGIQRTTSEDEAQYVVIARARLTRWAEVPMSMDEGESVGEARVENKKRDPRQVSLFAMEAMAGAMAMVAGSNVLSCSRRWPISEVSVATSA